MIGVIKGVTRISDYSSYHIYAYIPRRHQRKGLLPYGAFPKSKAIMLGGFANNKDYIILGSMMGSH